VALALQLVVPASTAVAAGGSGDALSRPSAIVADGTPLVDEVWQVVRDNFVDPGFNGEDWSDVREEFLARWRSGEPEGLLARQMVQRLGDRYSRVISKRTFESLTRFDPIGVGVLLSPGSGPEGTMAVTAEPFPGSSAAAAGLHKGDAVLEVDGASTRDVSATDLMRRVSTTDPESLQFRVLRPSTGEERSVMLRRSRSAANSASAPSVYSYVGHDAAGRGVGYVRVREWSQDAARELRAAVVGMEGSAVPPDMYVVDIRGNPGGGFEFALDAGGVFMQDKPMVRVDDGRGDSSVFASAGEPVTDKPVAVWIDRRSASASEVFYGGMRDACRGVGIGDTTFGKGRIQAVFGLGNREGLVLTVARFVTPSGDKIDGRGLPPAIVRNGGQGGAPGGKLPPLVELPLVPFGKFMAPDPGAVSVDDVVQAGRMCRRTGGA